MLRGLVVGLLAGLAFGAASGMADGAVLAIRAGHDFPADSTVRASADGTRYAVAPDGWRYVRAADGERYVRTSRPVHGFVGTKGPDRLALPTDWAEDWCSQLQCVAFHGRIEVHVQRGDIVVRLPSGAYAENWGFAEELPDGVSEWLYKRSPGQLFTGAIRLGLVIGLSIGITTGLYRLLASPADVVRTPGPLASLRADRATAITRGLLVTVCGFALSYLPRMLSLPVLHGDVVPFATLIWLVAGPLTIGLSAWGWLITSRIWLCGTGRLPWRLGTFLDEAHRKGVLRQAGAVYQFRHARLQERLAGRDSEQS
ncbi:hypothetical protein OOK58_42890 [Streptomyces sp. NBC_01728]|uniref:hypothetical protein n=1 Tax=unclassified Streptomyces TaxID=2593676 RepID=UPI00225904C3|nr:MULTISPECIES: hypothetical protein [unclassified Streptomyces]MCX4458659.1 hypothetical protein [Streptomyces sp. NBC_01719]MCX4498016.1 hypothetical protein [Streptomyces sp. NBC_01728]